jgi:hypothetical protein
MKKRKMITFLRTDYYSTYSAKNQTRAIRNMSLGNAIKLGAQFTSTAFTIGSCFMCIDTAPSETPVGWYV